MSKEIDLAKYVCSRCGSSPKSSAEILKTGCSNCGNGFFRIKQPESIYKQHVDSIEETLSSEETQNITIAVEERGIYNIDIEDLLNEKNPLVIGGKGVYRVSWKKNQV